MSVKVKVAMAPPKMGGDSIELDVLQGKLVAIFCKDRDEKKTRFGPRKMTQVYLATMESKDALMGIMFQSYFQDLALGQWYIGKVVRAPAGNNQQWILSTEGLDAKAVKALAKHLETVKLEDDSTANALLA